MLVRSHACSLALETACVLRSTSSHDGGSAGSGRRARVDFCSAGSERVFCQCLRTDFFTNLFHSRAPGGFLSILCSDGRLYFKSSLMMVVNHEFEASDLVAS